MDRCIQSAAWGALHPICRVWQPSCCDVLGVSRQVIYFVSCGSETFYNDTALRPFTFSTQTICLACSMMLSNTHTCSDPGAQSDYLASCAVEINTNVIKWIYGINSPIIQYLMNTSHIKFECGRLKFDVACWSISGPCILTCNCEGFDAFGSLSLTRVHIACNEQENLSQYCFKLKFMLHWIWTPWIQEAL